MPESKMNTFSPHDLNIFVNKTALNKLNRGAFPFTTNIGTPINLNNDTLQCRFETGAPIPVCFPASTACFFTVYPLVLC